jgi:hypothetical protein
MSYGRRRPPLEPVEPPPEALRRWREELERLPAWMWSMKRRCIVMTTRSQNRLAELAPEHERELGWGVRWSGTQWTAWFPRSREWEERIIAKLEELGIPHWVYEGVWGRPYEEVLPELERLKREGRYEEAWRLLEGGWRT